MSWRALYWASQKETGSTASKLVLIMLCNYADENNETYPSHNTLARVCECSKDTIMRHLKSLEEKGLITTINRFEKLENGKNRQTSNLYKINVDTQSQFAGGRESQNAMPITLKKENKKYKKDLYDKQFELFWNVYPRNDGSKIKAQQYFKKAIQEISVDKLMNITNIYCKNMRGVPKKFIPHATTFLNQMRYETVDINNDNKKNTIAG